MRGTFRAICVDVGFDKGQNGTEFCELFFEPDVPPSEKKRVRWSGSFTPKGVEYIFKSLTACGWDGKTSLRALRARTHLTKPVEIVLEEEMGTNGGVFTVVKWVNEIRAAKRNIDPARLDELSKQLTAWAGARVESEAHPSPRDEGLPVARDGYTFDDNGKEFPF